MHPSLARLNTAELEWQHVLQFLGNSLTVNPISPTLASSLASQDSSTGAAAAIVRQVICVQA